MGFKKGDKVVCVDVKVDFYNKRINLTYGEVYEVLEDSVKQRLSNFDIVLIKNNYQFDEFYDARKFVSVCNYRTNTINEILD